jgi:hypothetical protein
MMNVNNKKHEERRIFDLIYADCSFDEVKDCENPDFLVRYSPNTPYFGVEVTKYYLSETDARIDNIPYYSTQLLNGKGFKHKDDRQVISKVDIINDNGTVFVKDVPAIFQELPQPSKCANDIARRISFKASRLQDSMVEISHTNLIINDKTGLLRKINKKNFYGTYFIPELIEAISASPFREIFLVTFLQDEHVYAPLKMLYLLAEVYLFNAVIVDKGYDKNIPSEICDAELFAAYLNSTVIYNVLIHRDTAGTEIIFGDSGILIGNDNSVTVRLHSDYPIHSDAKLPNIEWQAILGDNFDDVMRDYRKSNIFSTGAVFPVKQCATRQNG